MASLPPHLHIGFIEFITTFLYVIISLFLIRVLEVWMGQNVVGQALSFIH